MWSWCEPGSRTFYLLFAVYAILLCPTMALREHFRVEPPQDDEALQTYDHPLQLGFIICLFLQMFLLTQLSFVAFYQAHTEKKQNVSVGTRRGAFLRAY